MSEGVVIVMIPDGTYQTATPDAHCTVGYFGKIGELFPFQREILEGICEDIAKMKPYWAKPPKVTGRGCFRVDPQFNDGNTHCYVDLIDDPALPLMRKEIEDRAGFVNRGHGFIPHMTLSYSTSWIPSQAQPSGMYSFTWNSVQLWLGNERKVFRIDKPESN